MKTPMHIPKLNENIPTKISFARGGSFINKFTQCLLKLGWLKDTDWNGSIVKTLNYYFTKRLNKAFSFDFMDIQMGYSDDVDSIGLEVEGLQYCVLSLNSRGCTHLCIQSGTELLEDWLPGFGYHTAMLLQYALEETFFGITLRNSEFKLGMILGTSLNDNQEEMDIPCSEECIQGIGIPYQVIVGEYNETLYKEQLEEASLILPELLLQPFIELSEGLSTFRKSGGSGDAGDESEHYPLPCAVIRWHSHDAMDEVCEAFDEHYHNGEMRPTWISLFDHTDRFDIQQSVERLETVLAMLMRIDTVFRWYADQDRNNLLERK